MSNTYTIEGRDTWCGDRFWYSARREEVFTSNEEARHIFASIEDACAVAELLVKLSEKDPFLGYEEIEIIETSAGKSHTIDKKQLKYYRAS